MRLREHTNETNEQTSQLPAGSPPPGSGEGLNELRAAGTSALAQGQAIIDAALSGNSSAFLSATRQMGGQ